MGSRCVFLVSLLCRSSSIPWGLVTLVPLRHALLDVFFRPCHPPSIGWSPSSHFRTSPSGVIFRVSRHCSRCVLGCLDLAHSSWSSSYVGDLARCSLTRSPLSLLGFLSVGDLSRCSRYVLLPLAPT